MSLFTIALVIFFNGSTDGGRAINAELRFSTLGQCEAAARTINATKTSSGGFSNHWLPTAVCIDGVIK
jgi:hypothetical protein